MKIYNRVFKYILGDPKTPLYKPQWKSSPTPSLPDGLLLDFLNGAAKLTSLDEFLKMAQDKQLDTLVKYLHAFAKWDNAGLLLEQAGYGNYSDTIKLGVRVCRHLSVLLGMLLSEAGFNNDVLSFTYKDTESGHAWNEVYLGDRTIVIDPSNLFGVINDIETLRKRTETKFYLENKKTKVPFKIEETRIDAVFKWFKSFAQ